MNKLVLIFILSWFLAVPSIVHTEVEKQPPEPKAQSKEEITKPGPGTKGMPCMDMMKMRTQMMKMQTDMMKMGMEMMNQGQMDQGMKMMEKVMQMMEKGSGMSMMNKGPGTEGAGTEEPEIEGY